MAEQSDFSTTGIIKYHETGAANAALVLTTPAISGDKPQRLLWVSVKYSAAPNHAGVSIELDSSIGTEFDTLILSGSANDEDVFFLPDSDLVISSKDAIRVTAPAGGASITASIVVQMEA